MFDELLKENSCGLLNVAHLEFLLCVLMTSSTYRPEISRVVKFTVQELSAESILTVIAILLVCRDQNLEQTMTALKMCSRHSL